MAIEIKSGRTPSPRFFDNLEYWKNHLEAQESKPECYVIYADNKDE